ncbi:MAG: hypothetical protein B7X10_00545 [Burkholderiales bacterium 21-58-4]|nr:MAG: hypothetical protein B7X10_00545 [Burkholderiales bacterium 21-58-4]
MSFDATARLATEKQDMPACLPLVSSTGGERAVMHYKFYCGEATLALKPTPTVFIKTPSLPGIHSYLASQFLERAAESSDFKIYGDYPDQETVFICAAEVHKFTDWIRSKVEAEDVAYRRLLDVYYTNEKPLPAELRAVCRLVLATTDEQREAVRVVLDEFFQATPDGWINHRADIEIDAMRDKQSMNETRDLHEKERMRRHRERRAEMFAALRQVNVIPAWDISIKELQRLFDLNCNVTSATPETDLQREQVVSCNAAATAIPTPTPTPKKEIQAQAPLPDWMPMDAWDGYVEMRRKNKKTMTARAMALVVKALEAMYAKGFDIAQVLDNSTRQNWTDVYEPKSAPTTKGAGVRPGTPEYAKLHKDADWWREAGFADVWDANSSMCWEHNAHQFHAGKRVEVAA